MRRIRFPVSGLVLLALVLPAAALDGPGAPDSISLVVGRGTVIDCPDGVERVATSNPEAVDAVVASDREVLFHAKALGQATLVIWSKNGSRRLYEVTVEPNLEPLRQLLHETFPAEKIELEATKDSLALVGRVSTQAVADRALALVNSAVKGAVSNLQVAPPPSDRQILLKVRFAEVDRSAAIQFGMNLLSTGAAGTVGRVATGQFPAGEVAQLSGSTPRSSSSTTTFALSDLLNIFAFRPDLNLGLLIQDLETRGLLQILAEPDLVATNGKKATFLAGGEFPIPVVQAGAAQGAITVEFREFGIRLSFLPQITPSGTLRLHVEPEVSTIDAADGITVSGFRIPALSTRRIETDVELSEGQSFVIAGLLDQRVTQDLSRLPGLANIPLLGALFRSRLVTKSNDELLVVVTPHMAAPVTGDAPTIQAPVTFMGPAGEGRKKK